MRAPTTARWMNDDEWEIVTRVFTSDKLPYKQRIFVTDALGAYNAPFTIPTSLVSSLPAVLASGFGGGLIGGPAGAALAGMVGGAVSYILSAVNAGYLMNVGTAAQQNMATYDPDLLVHETAHVWQGRNSTFALTYTIESALNQCAGIAGGSGRGAAYAYTPGHAWSSYNPEQQAKIVEHWYAAGEPTSGALWPYVRDYVRRGIV
ncbi:MAG: hypothetical protein KDA64_01915 [Rhodospirillaceae bacterium]|nr:hypothetical protein [Rhodospirillaceae bacterium]